MPHGLDKTHPCPTCGKEFRYGEISESPNFPFCSQRCKMVDLGRWLTGGYSIPGAPAPGEKETEKKS